MNRRGFLQGLLGLAATAALPAPAIAFIEKYATVADSVFIANAYIDEGLIALIEMRMRKAEKLFVELINKNIYDDSFNAPSSQIGLGKLLNG